MRSICLFLLLLALLLNEKISPAAENSTTIRTELFDRDPHWDGVNNRMEKRKLAVTQDFGYSESNFAGKEKGEIGGTLQRSTVRAYYADKIATKTLDDKLGASGTFAITDRGHSGAVFGWFNSQQPDGGRPVAALGLNFGLDRVGGHLAVRLITAANQSCGISITPVIKPKPRGEDAALRRTIRNDGTRYSWNLDYDPRGANGNGQIQFTIHSEGKPQPELDGKIFKLDLPAGFRRQATTFDRFGLINMGKSGGATEIYFDDLVYDGKAEDFSKDPGWIGSANRGTVEEEEQSGVANFGFSEKTNFAGGRPGEAGGVFWRGGRAHGYYADRVGPFTLDERLEASGKVQMLIGAPDSGLQFGWFNSADKLDATPRPNFLGVSIAGPTRVGHYFAPCCTTMKGTRNRSTSAPVLMPGRVYNWSLVYDPLANDGKGSLQVTLGSESVTFPLKEKLKSEGASFDRFGFFTDGNGGQMVKIYFDDLRYTAHR